MPLQELLALYYVVAIFYFFNQSFYKIFLAIQKGGWNLHVWLLLFKGPFLINVGSDARKKFCSRPELYKFEN